MVLYISSGPDAFLPLGPDLCACPHAHECLGCAHVQGVCVCLVCMCAHTGKGKWKRSREAEAGRVWFLVTEKLEDKGTVLVWEWGAEATWHCLSRNQDLRRPRQRALALGPGLPHSSSPLSTSTRPTRRHVTQTLHPSINAAFWVLSSVQSLSRVQLFATPWTAACQASLSITSSQSLLKLMSTESVMPSNHLILSRSLLLCSQSFPATGSFPVSQLFASGGQSIGVSASASVLPVNIQDRSPLGWTGWISLQSKGLSRVFSNTTVQKGTQDPAVPSPSDPNPLPSSV